MQHVKAGCSCAEGAARCAVVLVQKRCRIFCAVWLLARAHLAVGTNGGLPGASGKLSGTLGRLARSVEADAARPDRADIGTVNFSELR